MSLLACYPGNTKGKQSDFPSFTLYVFIPFALHFRNIPQLDHLMHRSGGVSNKFMTSLHCEKTMHGFQTILYPNRFLLILFFHTCCRALVCGEGSFTCFLCSYLLVSHTCQCIVSGLFPYCSFCGFCGFIIKLSLSLCGVIL